MAKLRLTSPTFDASAKTITHASFSDVTLAGIQLIVNVTDQIIIYNFADTAKGGTLAGDVLTLEYDTTTMSDTDELMVLVEDGIAYQIPTGAATSANQTTAIAHLAALEASLGSVEIDVSSILAAVDGIETLIGSTNTKLDTVIGHLDGVETTLTTIDGRVDGLETLATATNTKLDTVNTNLTTIDGRVDGLETSNSAIQTSVQLIDDLYADLMVTGQGSQTALNQNVILASAGATAYDTQAGTTGISFRSFSIQIVPAAGTVTAGVITFEGSNDNTNFTPIFLIDEANVTAIPVSTVTLAASTTRYFKGSIMWRYIRARISTGITGTTTGVQAFTRFSVVPLTDTRLTVSQATAASLNATITGVLTTVTPGTAATNLGKARDSAIGATDTGVAVLGVRRDTPTAETPVAGDYVVPQVSANGEQWVRLAGELADDAAFTVATTRIVPVGFLADETATDSVDEGDAGIARMTLDRKQIVANYAHTAGGATPYKLVSAATTNATSVKASAGTVYMITASNVNAAARYLKLYNKASAPTVGTDTPVFTFIIPGNTAGAGTNIPVPNVGLNFSTGIAFALTTEATDAGTTAVAASEIVVNLAYA